MSVPDGVPECICRLALMVESRIDMALPGRIGARVVGYVIDPDESYGTSDGLFLLAALEDAAGVDLGRIKDNLTTFKVGR